mgnify:CR=1 FL=1
MILTLAARGFESNSWNASTRAFDLVAWFLLWVREVLRPILLNASTRAFGLVAWFSLWVREVPSSILGMCFRVRVDNNDQDRNRVNDDDNECWWWWRWWGKMLMCIEKHCGMIALWADDDIDELCGVGVVPRIAPTPLPRGFTVREHREMTREKDWEITICYISFIPQEG